MFNQTNKTTMKKLTTWSLMLTLMITISCTSEDSLISNPDNAMDPSNDVESISNARAAASGVSVPVFNAVMPGEVGTATIKKNNKGFTVKFAVSDLIQGHTYTLWCVAWNLPENCTTPNQCSDVDFAIAGDVEVEVMYIAGHLVGKSGKGNFSGHLNEWDDSGSTNAFFGLPGFGGLQDVDLAELHFVLRSHGPAIPGLVNEQINSYEGGCTTFFDPFTQIPMNEGECGDFLFSIFPPGC